MHLFHTFSHSKSFQSAPSCPALLWCAALYIGDVLQRPRHPVAHAPISLNILNSHSNPYWSSSYTVARQIYGYSLIKSCLQCFINSTTFSSSQCTASVQTLKHAYTHDKLRVQTAMQCTASEMMKLISILSRKFINWCIWQDMTILWRHTTSWMPWSHIPAIHPAPEERKRPVMARLHEAHPDALRKEKRNKDGKGWEFEVHTCQLSLSYYCWPYHHRDISTQTDGFVRAGGSAPETELEVASCDVKPSAGDPAA